MKNRIIHILQKLFGFENYLFIFSIFTILKLRYDRNEKDFFKLFDLIEDGGLILDIGANIGVMTTHFARRMKNSTVYCFEPLPFNIRTIKRVITFYCFRNVKIYEFALGDSEKKIRMRMPMIKSAKKQGLSHVIRDDNYSAEEKGEDFEVECRRLDSFEEVLNSEEKVTAIKIDVEGYELSVLKGAVETIRKQKPVVYCEIWPGEEREVVIDFMKSLGYQAKVVVKKNLIAYDDHPNQNFFFIYKS